MIRLTFWKSGHVFQGDDASALKGIIFYVILEYLYK